MKAFQKKLKIDVEKKIGFKILSTTEARALQNLLLEQDIYDLSLSTIRRFWGLIPNRKPNEKTLNALAAFLGYKTYLDYVTSKNRFEEWFNISQIQRLKSKDKLTKSDFKFIETLYRTESTTFVSVSLFEHAVNFEKWNYIQDLLNPDNISLLQDNTDVTEYAAKQAYLLAIYLKSIPIAYFNAVIDKLIQIDGFRYYCVYLYVDIIHLNHRYGAVINKIIATVNKDKEEVLFLTLLKNLWNYLNGNSLKPVAFDEQELKKLPYVLIGRYYGYQILHNTLEEDDTAVEFYWKLFLDGINSETEIRQYLNEFTHHLLLAKRFKKLEYILDNFYEAIMDNFHLHHYLDVFLFGLIDVIISYQSGNAKRANLVFANLDTSKIIYGSYCDYYLIFYNLIGYHLANDTQEKQNFKKDYLNLSQDARFFLFNEAYLKYYFVNESD
jgi:hypothetical protein